MGVTGNFCACTVMRMNILEMTSRMHTKTPLRPLQLEKRHRLLGFDHLLGSTHSCGDVNGSKAQGIQIALPESDVRDESSRKTLAWSRLLRIDRLRRARLRAGRPRF